MAFVDATIVNIAFPDIAESFPSSDFASLSWILNSYNIVFAAFLVAAGRLADLLGRRRIFLIGLLVFTVASALCAFAPSVASLTAFRVLQALGAALVVPSSLALVLHAYPAERRAHAVALLTAIAALAAGLGPALGGFLVSADGWRLVFLVNVPLGIAAYALARKKLVESREPGRRMMPDLLGAVIFAAAVALLILGVVQEEHWGWNSPAVLGSLAAGIALGVVFVRRSKGHRSPVVDLDMLRNRTFAVANLATITASAGLFGYTLINVLFLTGVWQYSYIEAGLALTPGPFVAAAFAGPTSRLVGRIGHRPVLVAGGLFWAAAICWFIFQVGPQPEFLSEWLPGVVLLGIGAGTMFSNLGGAAIASAPGEGFATATGMNSVARQMGAAFGVAAVVAIIGTPGPEDALRVFDDAWTFSAICLAVSGLICLGVGRIGSEDDVSRSPSLGDSTRLVFGKDRPVQAVSPAEPVAAKARPQRPAERRESRPETTADFLAKAPIFAPLSEASRATIAGSSEAISLEAGEVLFREGEDAGTLFVVRAGRLEVFNESAGVIRSLGRGAAIGELGLLTSMPRSASVRAARKSDLIAIDRSEFDRVLKKHPEVSVSLTRVLGSQLRDSVGPAPASRDVPATIVIVRLDDGVDTTALASQLTTALSIAGTADMLDETCAGFIAAGSGSVETFAPHVDAAEKANDQVVLAANSPFEPDPWTAYCLQHVDRILAVSSGATAPGDFARQADLKGCDLVAWNVERGSGRLTAWADALEPSETHAVRAESDLADIQRMSRRLSGTSVGIVLSGGGARALSHIGVLEELLAAGVLIDRVAGVSMGAFIGGMLAMEMDPEEIDARCYEEYIRRKPLGDYTFPRHSLIRGDRARAMLERTFGDVCIEELGRGFFTGAADLRSGELVLSRWGPLWEAVGMSGNLPVIGPPYPKNGRLLIDGSLVDNLPVETMAGMGEGPIIAVDIRASVGKPDRRGGASTAAAGAGAAEDAAATADFEPTVPGLLETLARVLLMGSSNTSKAAGEHADWVIAPKNHGVGLLEFHQIDAARESGRKAAREALEHAPPSIL